MATAKVAPVRIDRYHDGDNGYRFDYVLRAFLRSRERGEGTAIRMARKTTLDTYKSDLQYFFEFMEKRFGHKYWNQMSPNDVSDYVDWVRTKTGWGESTQRKRLISLRVLMRWIEDDEDCREAGMCGSRLQSMRKKVGKLPRMQERIFVPSHEEVKAIAGCWNMDTRSGLRNYTMIMLMAGTGMRSGEVRLLKMEHLALQDKMLHVPEEGKTGFRVVWLTADLVTDMRRWLRMRETFSLSEYVFPEDTGRNHMGVTTLVEIFITARKATGVEGVTAHTLRHYFCTNWVRNGGDIKKLMTMTGHKRLDTLNIYLNLAGDQSVADELERIAPAKKARPDYRRGRPRTRIG